MRPRTRLAVVALLTVVGLAVAGGALGQSGGQESVVGVENTTNKLSLADPAADGHATAGVDVGTAVAADAHRLAGLHDRLTLDERIAQAEEPVTRATIREAVGNAEDRVAGLEAERGELLAAHGDGELSTAALASELVRLNAAADRERALLDRLAGYEADSEIPFPSVEANLTALETTESLLGQPALEQLEAAAAGTTDRLAAYVQTGPDGLVVATVGDEYVRQAFLNSERNRTGANQFTDSTSPGWSAAIERANEIYPWAFANEPSISGIRTGNVYRIDIGHPHGSLEAFFDGATTNVFHEHQFAAPEAVPVTAVETATADGVELRVAVTHATGPIRVSVTEGGQPVAGATVTIGGREVGQTDANGELRLVQPDGPFEVSATTVGGTTVSVVGA